MRGSSRRLTPKSLHRRLGVPRAPPLLRLSQLLPLAFLRPPRPRSARRFRCRPLLPPLPRGAFDRRSRLGATRLRQRAVVPSSAAPPPAPLQSLAASRLGVAPVCSALPALRYRPHAAVAPPQPCHCRLHLARFPLALLRPRPRRPRRGLLIRFHSLLAFSSAHPLQMLFSRESCCFFVCRGRFRFVPFVSSFLLFLLAPLWCCVRLFITPSPCLGSTDSFVERVA